MIVFGHYTEGSPAADDSRSVLRVVQSRADLRKTIRTESTRSTVFRPSSFDAARPFTVEVELSAGRHRFQNRLLVGVPPRRTDPARGGKRHGSSGAGRSQVLSISTCCPLSDDSCRACMTSRTW